MYYYTKNQTRGGGQKHGCLSLQTHMDIKDTRKKS